MPPLLIIPPLAKLAIGALGAGAAAHWLARQIRRVNEDLDRIRRASIIDPATREGLPTLRRDPQSGHWRVP